MINPSTKMFYTATIECGYLRLSDNSDSKNRRAWATGDDNGASANSAVNEYLAIERDGNCT